MHSIAPPAGTQVYVSSFRAGSSDYGFALRFDADESVFEAQLHGGDPGDARMEVTVTDDSFTYDVASVSNCKQLDNTSKQ